MNPHRPTAGNGVHRTTRLLLAIATAITLTVVIACSREEPPPTDHPDGNPPKLKQATATQHDTTAVPTDGIEKNDSQQANILVLHTAGFIATGVIFLTLLDALSEDEGNPQPQTSEDST